MWYPNLPWDNSFLMCKNKGVRRASKSSQTHSSNRNEKDWRNAIWWRVRQISATDDISGPVSCQKCGREPLVKRQNTKVLLN